MTRAQGNRVTAYLRDKGVVCFELRLFFSLSNGAFREQVTTELLSSGLDWYWTSSVFSARSNDLSQEDSSKTRKLTLLSSGSQDEFTFDFGERLAHREDRHVIILAAAPDLRSNLCEELELKRALDNFVAEERGPICAIILQEGDGSKNQIYVPHAPLAQVEQLLGLWKVDLKSIGWWHRRNYRRLGVIQLERLVNVVVDMAMGRT